MNRCFAVVLLGLVFPFSSPAFSQISEMRTWTDQAGRQLQAELDGIRGETLRLRKADGSEIAVSRSSLSQADQDFVKQLIDNTMARINAARAMRTWTGPDGNTFEARVSGHGPDRVFLTKADGERVTMMRSELAPADQEFVRKRIDSARRPPARDSSPAADEPFRLSVMRTWTDSTGKFTTEAKIVVLGKREVTLAKVDGTQVRLPVSKLSAADQAFIQKAHEHLERSLAEPAARRAAENTSEARPSPGAQPAGTSPSPDEAVALEVRLGTWADGDAVRAILEERLVEQGWKIDQESPVRLVAGVGFEDLVKCSFAHEMETDGTMVAFRVLRTPEEIEEARALGLRVTSGSFRPYHFRLSWFSGNATLWKESAGVIPKVVPFEDGRPNFIKACLPEDLSFYENAPIPKLTMDEDGTVRIVGEPE